MRFGLLGPLEVRTGDRVVALGGAKQRALLVLLLLHANEVVTRDLLLEALWPERPGDAARSLDHQISRLRKALAPEAVETRPGGYLLRVELDDLDAHRFERALARGREANAAGRPKEALAALDEALALWRGPALAEVADEPFAQVQAARLDELRLVAREERFDAELALGHHHELVPELEALAAQQPLRERVRAQLMLALYRSGRQAEALRVYADARRTLVDELGLEPGPALQQLERSILSHDRSLAAPARAHVGRRSRAAAIATVLFAAAAALVGVLLARGGAPGSPARAEPRLNSVTFVSARTGRVVGETDGLESPIQSVYYAGALWNLSFSGILSKIDPQTGRVVGTANVAPVPCGLAAGEGALWVSACTSPSIARIDPAHDAVVGRSSLPLPRRELATATQSVAVGAGSVWVGQGFDNPSYVWRLDPASGRVQHRYVIPEGGAEALAFGDGALWVGGGIIGRLSRIDPITNAVTTPARDFGDWLCCVAAGGGYIWVAVNPGGTVWKLSEHGDVLSSAKTGSPVEQLDYADGAVWAAAGNTGMLLRIDATTDAVRQFVVGHNVMGSALHKGVLAVSVQPAGKDVITALRGRIAVLVLSRDDLDATSTDPLGTQFAFNAAQVQFQYATCAKLFNYPDAAGAAGKALVPELAAGLPVVTGGGRTYTIRVRSGFGFSPPSHEQVTAASFRHALERFLSPAGGTFDPMQLLGDVVGAKAFASGKAPHLAGVTANGDTLVIRLLAPSGDLTERLALPAFCAVPPQLPTVPHGLPYPIPTAGPYYLADRSTDVLVLKPNPNYHGSRPRRLDAIIYKLGIDPGIAAAGIARGTFDYIATPDPVLAPSTLAARSAGPRYQLIANNWTARLALNTAKAPFSDASVRRAVAYALDRSRLARSLDNGDFQLPTSSLLPPNLRGPARSPFPLRPNPAQARRLLHGRRINVVLAASADEAGKIYDPKVVETLRIELASIGIRLTVVPLPQTLKPAQRDAALAASDLATVSGNQDDARDAGSYLLGLPYLPPADRAQLRRIARLLPPKRWAAVAAVASRLERDADYIGYADAATPRLVSRRLGCLVDQPEYPVLDLAALCLRKG